MRFATGEKVRVRADVHDDMYPGATGTIVLSGNNDFPYRFAPDEFRAGDDIGREIVAQDGGWLMSEGELEAI